MVRPSVGVDAPPGAASRSRRTRVPFPSRLASVGTEPTARGRVFMHAGPALCGRDYSSSRDDANTRRLESVKLPQNAQRDSVHQAGDHSAGIGTSLAIRAICA